MLLPKALLNLSGGEALLDLSGWLMKGLRQVSGTQKRDCATTRNSSFENGVDRKGAPSPNEFATRSLAENTEAVRRWSSGGRLPARCSRSLARRPALDLVKSLHLIHFAYGNFRKNLSVNNTGLYACLIS